MLSNQTNQSDMKTYIFESIAVSDVQILIKAPNQRTAEAKLRVAISQEQARTFDLTNPD